MQLIEVDPIGAQTPQAGLDRPHDVAAGGAFHQFAVAHGLAELGGEHDIGAARTEDLTEIILGSAMPIAVRRIEEGDSEIERLVHHSA